MPNEKIKPKLIIQAIRFGKIGFIQTGYKVTWPDRGYYDDSDFEAVETTFVQTHNDADLLELRIYEFKPGEMTPDGSVTLQLWDKKHDIVVSQSGHAFPPQLKPDPVPDTGADREPQPTDGPDYHADHAAWEQR